MFSRLSVLILTLIFLSFAAEARRPGEYAPSLHLMVYVQKGLPLSQWVHALPKGSQIIREAHPYYIVRLPRAPDEALLRKLRSIQGMKAVYEDKLIKPADLSEKCPRVAQSGNIEDLKALVEIAADDCDLAPSCSEDGRPALQAQMSVGGDLMLEELKRMGLKDGHTKVAVLDTGFSSSLMPQMSRKLNWNYSDRLHALQFSRTGPHGSNVTGLIGAKNGVGLAPGADIGIFNPTVDEEGDASASLIEFQALEACKSGHKIINISYERLYTDRDKPHLVRDLEAEGCMVVNSAGNTPGSGITGPDPEDGWLRVGGLDMETGKNSQLELGEVNAPGFDVATLDPQAEGKCMGMPMTAPDGTSLGTPIVSAILANVRGILARDPKFEALAGPDQVKLLNRIVKASVSGGVVNGLRAVLTAEQWTEAVDPKPSSAQEIADLLTKNPPSRCKAPAKNPLIDQISCDQRKASIADMRFRIAACTPLPQVALEKMIVRLPNLGEPQLAKALSRHLPAERSEALAKEIERTKIIKERREKMARVERQELMKEKMAAIDTLLNLQSIPASEMSRWHRQLAEVERNSELDLIEAQREWAALERSDVSLRQDQDASLRAEIAELRSAKACATKWRNGMGKIELSTENYYNRVAVIEKDAHCIWPLDLMSEPYQEIGREAVKGSSFSDFTNGLVRQKSDYQLELMLNP